MEFEKTIEIDAPKDVVWAALADVERWPTWTASVTRVERLNTESLTDGARVRIKQPKMPTLVWEVTDFQPGTAFTWRSVTTGVTSVGTHVVETTPRGSVAVTLGIRQWGLLAPIVRLLSSRRTRRYVQMEAEGLKHRCEAA